MSHQWLFLWKYLNVGRIYCTYVRLLRQIVPKWMVHSHLTCFSLPALHPHAHRVVFREVRRPDPQQLNCWSTLSLPASLHPSCMPQCHFVSVCVRVVCMCLWLCLVDASFFFTACMIVSFQYWLLVRHSILMLCSSWQRPSRSKCPDLCKHCVIAGLIYPCLIFHSYFTHYTTLIRCTCSSLCILAITPYDIVKFKWRSPWQVEWGSPPVPPPHKLTTWLTYN